MAKKTFKIGEYCKGGVITVETKKTRAGIQVDIIAKDWDHSAGSSKSSDQSKAKEFDRETVVVPEELYGSEIIRKMDNFLSNLTTSYYTDQVMEWIKGEVPALKKQPFGSW